MRNTRHDGNPHHLQREKDIHGNQDWNPHRSWHRYILGTRAGRERYEQIRANASKLRRVPIVARPLDAAGQKMSDLVRAGGEQVTDKVADAVKERLFGAPASEPTTVDAQATSSTPHR